VVFTQGIAEKVRRGGRVDRDEALALYLEAPTALLGELADGIRARKHPERIVTYIIDRNVNYTNICVARCNFCAFYRPVGSGEGYVLGFEEIFAKIDETIELGGGQLLLQGGHNPDLPIFPSSGTRTCFVPSRHATPRSGSTHCRRPKSFT
jgi:cyclic dehypoxanthinyl futalosine synthase